MNQVKAHDPRINLTNVAEQADKNEQVSTVVMVQALDMEKEMDPAAA